MKDNRTYLIRLWIPALLGIGFVGFLTIAALTSGEPARMLAPAFGIVVAALLFGTQRWRIKRRFTRGLRSEDPTAFLRWFASTTRRVPHGAYFTAAQSATIFALYGRFDDAEKSLASVSWDGVPPLIEAQASAARAILAYARGEISDGLDHAVAATLQGSVESTFPGAATSELAFRTIRNVGLALAGRATATTEQELRTAFTTLPLLGRINAAWGLAAIAKKEGANEEHASMIAFIRQNAPHFGPVLAA